MIYFIGAICAFFTILTIWKPNIMWAILGMASYGLLLWFVRTYPPFTAGTLGDVIFICFCIGGAAFLLLYTVNDGKKKREATEKEARENGEIVNEGTSESADEYFDRLSRVTKRK